MIRLIMISLILTTLSFGQDLIGPSTDNYQSHFCRETTEINLNNTRGTNQITKKSGYWKIMSALLQLVYSPSSPVKMQELISKKPDIQNGHEFLYKNKNENNSEQESQITDTKFNKSLYKKYIFLGLKSVYLNNIEKLKIKEINEHIKVQKEKILALAISQELIKTTTIENCLDLVKIHENDFLIIKELSDYIFQNDILIQKNEAAISFEIAIKKLTQFTKQGFEIIPDATYSEVYKLMNNKFTSEALFVVHSLSDENNSNENGKIADASGAFFPKNFFNRVPSHVKKIIIYSCHPMSVIDYYQINQPHRSYSFYYPELKNDKFKFLFDSTVPLISLGSVRHALNATNSKMTKLAPPKINQCLIKIDYHIKSDYFDLFLNNDYLGSFDPSKSSAEFLIDCKKFQINNYIDIFSQPGNLDINTPRFDNIVIFEIQSNTNITQGLIKNHYSPLTQTHRVSKYSFQLTKDFK